MIPGAELLETPARQAAVARKTQHRPWPLPEEPWVMAQTWNDLLFAHHRVPAAELRGLVPADLELDERDGSAWLGVTPFVISGLRFRGLPPLPLLSTFPELNVRTYVTAHGKPGVWFFSLDAASRFAVEAARHGYKLPYFHARMSAERHGETIRYSSERLEGEHRFVSSYRPRGEVFEARPGSLEWFLTERYCLYAVDRGSLRRADIHHPPWSLQAAEAELETNTMAPSGVTLPDGGPLCHFSRRQDVLIWPLAPLG